MHSKKENSRGGSTKSGKENDYSIPNIPLKYCYINHEDQRFFVNLKSSQIVASELKDPI